MTARTVCGLIYEDGANAQDILIRLVSGFRARGLLIAGTIQTERARPDRRHCDMMLENLATGELVHISEDRGPLASGCRLDRDAFARVEAAVRGTLESRPVLVIVNKFGKTEIEGGGLRGVIADAMERDIPVLVGVPVRNGAEWADFVGEHAEVATDETAVKRWIASAGVPAA